MTTKFVLRSCTPKSNRGKLSRENGNKQAIMYQFPRAAVPKHHETFGLNNRNLFSYSSGSRGARTSFTAALRRQKAPLRGDSGEPHCPPPPASGGRPHPLACGRRGGCSFKVSVRRLSASRHIVCCLLFVDSSSASLLKWYTRLHLGWTWIFQGNPVRGVREGLLPFGVPSMTRPSCTCAWCWPYVSMGSGMRLRMRPRLM